MVLLSLDRLDCLLVCLFAYLRASRLLLFICLYKIYTYNVSAGGKTEYHASGIHISIMHRKHVFN